MIKATRAARENHRLRPAWSDESDVGIGLMKHTFRSEVLWKEHLPYMRGVSLHRGATGSLARGNLPSHSYLELDVVRATVTDAWNAVTNSTVSCSFVNWMPRKKVSWSVGVHWRRRSQAFRRTRFVTGVLRVKPPEVNLGGREAKTAPQVGTPA